MRALELLDGPVEPLRPLLCALDGVAYLVSADGVILEVGTPAWQAFADDGGAGDLTRERVIGEPLERFIASKVVADAYGRIHRYVLAAGRHVSFEYRCDAPDVRRLMRMSVSAVLGSEGGPAALLYQSQVLSAVQRPWMTLFEPERIIEARRAEARLPIAVVCSFCHAVRAGEGCDPEWVAAEAWYRQAAIWDVQVSHGVCPSCSARLDALVEEARETRPTATPAKAAGA